MKHLLTRHKLLNETIRHIEFTKPEIDYSEFFRLFNHFNNFIFNDIKTIEFDDSKYYTDIIPEDINRILNKKYTISNGLDILDLLPEEYHPIIEFFYTLFINGQNKVVDLNFLNNVYFGEDYKSNEQSFHNFIKNKHYLNTITDPDLKEYFLQSFKWFEYSHKIPTPVIINLNNNYYLLGGNRRICWLITKGYNKIPIWLLEK